MDTNGQNQKHQLGSIAMLSKKSHHTIDGQGDIDLQELIATVWKSKFKVISFTILFSIISIVYALSLPDTYEASTVLVATNQDSKSGLNGLASQYGDIAAIAGINIGGTVGENKIEHALELLRSWPYIEGLVKKYDLKATFMATNGWSRSRNLLIYNDNVYNNEKKTWLSDGDMSLEPTSYETFQEVVKHISIATNKDTGLINLSVSHYSPYIAKEIVNILTKELNKHFKKLDQEAAEAKINVLSNKIQQTKNNDMRQVFYNLIEKHTQTLLMTEVNDEYLIRTLVPVMLPEKKSGPKRALICVLGATLGMLFSIIYIVIRYISKNVRGSVAEI